MYYLIYAYTEEYGGINGMNSIEICEGTEKDAETMGYELSRELVLDFSNVVWSELDDDEIEDFINENIAFEFYEIKDGVDINLVENDLMNDNIATLIAKYCNIV